MTDGEPRRRNFMSDFTDAVDGFDTEDAMPRMWQAAGAGGAPVSSVNAKLKLVVDTARQGWG